jgi:hypothetical protein
MSDHFGHMETVAIRKAGIPGWEPYLYERIGDGVLMTGGIPRILKSGPRKGRKTWDRKDSTRVVVTRAETDAEQVRYEAETGNCGTCFSKGETVVVWSAADGEKYATCKHCNGTGRVEPKPVMEPA